MKTENPFWFFLTHSERDATVDVAFVVLLVGSRVRVDDGAVNPLAVATIRTVHEIWGKKRSLIKKRSPFDLFTFPRSPSLGLGKRKKIPSHRRTAWGVQRGRRWPQVTRLQCVEGQGMAGAGETLGCSWPTFAISPCTQQGHLDISHPEFLPHLTFFDGLFTIATNRSIFGENSI
jgi:hypothetical protein